MDSILLPFLLVVFASFFQGTFGLGMKYMAPLKWEAWWLVHVTIAMILLPVSWAFMVVPDLCSVIVSAPAASVWLAVLFGFLWGVGGILFGVSVPYIGISLTYGIVVGLAATAGSLIPLFQTDGVWDNPALPYILAGVALMFAGVGLTMLAGYKRDQQYVNYESKNPVNFKKGLIIATVSGVFSALLNVGFANAAPVADTAESFGALTRNSSLAAWVVVLLGGYLMNAGYAVFLLIKNKSWSSFSVSGSAKAYRWSIIAGFCWFAALGVYGQGAALLGEIGPVIGWPILLGLALVVSNVWAYRAGEWEQAKKPFKILLVGVLVLIMASAVLGYSNSL